MSAHIYDRGGERITAVLDSAINRRNCALYFVSPSVIRWLLPFRGR